MRWGEPDPQLGRSLGKREREDWGAEEPVSDLQRTVNAQHWAMAKLHEDRRALIEEATRLVRENVALKNENSELARKVKAGRIAAGVTLAILVGAVVAVWQNKF